MEYTYMLTQRDRMPDMTPVRLRALFLTVLAMCLFALPSNSSAGHADGALGDVEVTVQGNERTKRGYMIALAHRCLERLEPVSWETVNVEAIRQCIYDSRLFSEVSVEVSSPELKIQVHERWTLIPIPYFRLSDSQSSVGGFVVESNFMGRGKILVLGGMVGSEGAFYSVIYKDPSVLFSKWKLDLKALRLISKQRVYDGSDVLYATETTYQKAGASVGYLLTSRLEADVGAYAADRKYSQLDAFEPLGDISSTELEIGLKYDTTRYRLYFNEGVSVMTGMKKSVSDDDSVLLEAKLRWGLNPLRDHALIVGLQLDKTDTGHTQMIKVEGGTKGFRGIPSFGLWYEEGAFLSLDYNVPLTRRKYGTWTVGPFVDYGSYDHVFEASLSSYTAWGVAVNLYLNTIAIPGLGIQAGRNNEFMGDFRNFSIGMNM